MTLPKSRAPYRLLICLGPCHGEFYLPLGPDDAIVCPNDRTHPVAVYSGPLVRAGENATYRPPTCVCSHTAGDHQSGGASWPHPVRRGLCRVPGCGCQLFTDAEREETAA